MRRTEHSTTMTRIELEPHEVREALEAQARAGAWGPLLDPTNDSVSASVRADGSAVIEVTHQSDTTETAS